MGTKSQLNQGLGASGLQGPELKYKSIKQSINQVYMKMNLGLGQFILVPLYSKLIMEALRSSEMSI